MPPQCHRAFRQQKGVSESIVGATLGLRVRMTSLKSANEMGLVCVSFSSALPLWKSSLTTLSWTPWQMSLMSLPEYPSLILARLSRPTSSNSVSGSV